jgi:hypothetical protein
MINIAMPTIAGLTLTIEGLTFSLTALLVWVFFPLTVAYFPVVLLAMAVLETRPDPEKDAGATRNLFALSVTIAAAFVTDRHVGAGSAAPSSRSRARSLILWPFRALAGKGTRNAGAAAPPPSQNPTTVDHPRFLFPPRAASPTDWSVTEGEEEAEADVVCYDLTTADDDDDVEEEASHGGEANHDDGELESSNYRGGGDSVVERDGDEISIRFHEEVEEVPDGEDDANLWR